MIVIQMKTNILGLRSHISSALLLIVAAILSAGCSSRGKIANQPVAQLPDDSSSYSFSNHIDQNGIGNIMMVLAFSGGGTRAAALSYGVLEELRDTEISVDGQPQRLLDEIDRISSVSGGSFTAAYYGLYGDDIFNDYKDLFLYRDFEGELMKKIIRPFNALGRSFSSVSRTEDAIRFYDSQIFKGKTFADLQRRDTPYILINATDLNSHHQFVFSQRQFDFLCSDLNEFEVARAVAASSAVPVLFHPVLVKKHPDCTMERPDWLRDAAQRAEETGDKRLKEIVESMEHYLDDKNPPYATLVDGGVTDNLGLRAIYRNMMLSGGAVKLFYSKKETAPIQHIVVVVVNASTTAVTKIGRSDVIPSIFDVLTAVTDIQLHLYNTESNTLLRDELVQLVETLSKADSAIQPYFIEVSIEDVDDPEKSLYLNEIPTSFSLEKEQADTVIAVGRQLLRQNEEFRRLLTNLGAKPAGDDQLQ